MMTYFQIGSKIGGESLLIEAAVAAESGIKKVLDIPQTKEYGARGIERMMGEFSEVKMVEGRRRWWMD